MIEKNNLYCGKWEDLIGDVASNSIDLIITSPPYNVSLGIDNKHKKVRYDTYDDNLPYQEYLKWMVSLFKECNRILKNGGRICINIGDGANGAVPTHADFTYMLLHLSDFLSNADFNTEGLAGSGTLQDFKMITTIVWDKHQIGNSTGWGSWQSPSCPSFPTQFEYILVAGKGARKHEGSGKVSVSGENFIRNSRALWQFTPETAMMRKYGHPACFPEELPRRLIDQLTYVDDVVFDPFSGVGTTCAVAKKMERHYIGFEMSEKYHSKAEERLAMIPAIKGSLPEWMR